MIDLRLKHDGWRHTMVFEELEQMENWIGWFLFDTEEMKHAYVASHGSRHTDADGTYWWHLEVLTCDTSEKGMQFIPCQVGVERDMVFHCKIEAIKFVRHISDLGLKDAKTYADENGRWIEINEDCSSHQMFLLHLMSSK